MALYNKKKRVTGCYKGILYAWQVSFNLDTDLKIPLECCLGL